MFNGIMNYLRQQNKNQNPVDAGLLDVSVGTSPCSVHPKELFNGSHSDWYLKEIVDNYLLIDFMDAKVSIDGYSIESGSYNSYWQYPVGFTWEGTNDKNGKWSVIDKKDNNSEMGGNEKTHHWSCPKSPFYRYVRFRLHKIHSSGGLYTYQLELFGEYQKPQTN